MGGRKSEAFKERSISMSWRFARHTCVFRTICVTLLGSERVIREDRQDRFVPVAQAKSRYKRTQVPRICRALHIIRDLSRNLSPFALLFLGVLDQRHLLRRGYM